MTCSFTVVPWMRAINTIRNKRFPQVNRAAWLASSMYLTVQEVDLELIICTGVGIGRGTSCLKRAPLNLTIKKKQPRKTPWGEEPGTGLKVDVAP